MDEKLIEAAARAILVPYAERWKWARYHHPDAWKQFADTARRAIEGYERAKRDAA